MAAADGLQGPESRPLVTLKNNQVDQMDQERHAWAQTSKY